MQERSTSRSSWKRPGPPLHATAVRDPAQLCEHAKSQTNGAGTRARAGVAEAAARLTAKTACGNVPRRKILLYSHDTFGLGNIRRTLTLADALRQEYPDSAILIVTGSPVIHDFRIPEGVDYIKLPCVDRVSADHYQPRFMAPWPTEIAHVRAALLKHTVLGFAPDLMIVDKRAGGVDGELVETLEALHGSADRPRLVLGVRDILDEPERTRTSLDRSNFTGLVERYYDEVWIYGDQSLFDPVIGLRIQ